MSRRESDRKTDARTNRETGAGTSPATDAAAGRATDAATGPETDPATGSETDPATAEGSRDETRQGPPESPTDLSKPSWWGVVKRSARGFKTDGLTDWAAALTYYGVLSIFPALLATVAILGLFGSQAINPLLDNVATLAPGAVQDILTEALQSLEQNQGGALVFTIISIAIAVWSASRYVAAFMRASNAVYDMPEGRPIWKILPLRVAVTLVLVILLAVSAVIVVFTGGLAQRAGDVIGVGETAVTVWDIAKWPLLLISVILMLAILFWVSPNVRQPGFRWITPGSVLAVVLWIIASVAFGFYVANFGTFNEVYGTLGGVIVFLIWLWVTNLAILFGVEVDAELMRARAIAEGHPPEVEPYAEPRDTRKFPDRPQSPENELAPQDQPTPAAPARSPENSEVPPRNPEVPPRRR